MKYVKKRDSFLTGIKEYKETDNYKSLELIQEDGGPLHNAVEFGDSWVGRWIHNIMRAAKEKVDKMRISGQIRRLKMALDDIIQNNEAVKMEIIQKSKEEPGKEPTDPLKGDGLHDKFLKLQLHVFLDELNAAVEKGHKVSIIKSLTDNAIEEVEGTPEFEGKKKLLEQLKKFKDFLKDFDDDEGKEDPDFKQEKGEGDDEEEGDEDDKKDDKSEGLSTEKVFPAMIKCLKSLELVLINYKKLLTKDGKINIENKATEKEVYTYTTKAGDTVEKIFKSPEINKNKLQIADIRKKNEKTLKTYAKDNQTLAPNLKLVMENVEILSEDQDCWYIVKDEKFIIIEKFDIIDEAKQFGQGAGANRNSFSPEDKYAIEAFGKLKASAEQLEKSGVTAQFLAEITKQKMGGEEGKMYDLRKKPITNLFRQMNRFLVGDKKSTLNAPKDALYKENLETLSDNIKLIKIAENIATFAVRAQQFEKTGQNLYGAFGDLGDPLKEFAKTITEISKTDLGEGEKSEKPKGELKFKVGDLVTWTNKEGKTITKKIEKIEDGKYVFKKESGEEYTKKEDSLKKAEPKKEEEKKEEVKKESRLFRYDNYKLIKEADDDKEGVLSEVSRKILEFWKANVEVKAYILSKEEFEKLLKELEDAELDQEVEMPVSEGDPKSDKLPEPKKKKVKLTGLAFTIDPVLRIVKAFNKAYKLHTTEVIPSGRTTGAVSNRIFRQYTSLGNGSPDSAGKSGGPYRNNAVFNKWEEAVLDVMGESKYQKIFSPDTVLLRGGDLVEKAGANLRLFMSDLLDGEKLYKGSGSSTEKGAQSQFLDKYFGWKGDDKVLYDGADKEFKETQKVAGEVDKKTTEQIVSFTKDDIKFTQASELVGTMFKLEDADGGNSYYFYIHELVGDYYYVTYTRGYKFYHDLIHKEGKYGFPDLSKIKGDAKTPNDSYSSGDGEYIIRATKIATRNFDTKTGKLKPATYESTYIRKKDKKPFSNKETEVEKSTEKDTLTAKVGKIFILSVKKDKDDKEPKFATIEKKENLKDKGIFPAIKNTKNISDTDVIFKIG